MLSFSYYVDISRTILHDIELGNGFNGVE